jgi:hypothetical protein
LIIKKNIQSQRRQPWNSMPYYCPHAVPDMIEQGLWHDRTINQDLDACVAACPDKLALTAYRVEAG